MPQITVKVDAPTEKAIAKFIKQVQQDMLQDLFNECKSHGDTLTPYYLKETYAKRIGVAIEDEE